MSALPASVKISTMMHAYRVQMLLWWVASFHVHVHVHRSHSIFAKTLKYYVDTTNNTNFNCKRIFAYCIGIMHRLVSERLTWHDLHPTLRDCRTCKGCDACRPVDPIDFLSFHITAIISTKTSVIANWVKDVALIGRFGCLTCTQPSLYQ